MAAVESTIAATALPSIVADLGGFHLFSWVFAVYLLGQAVTIPIYGRLADLHARKRVFAVGAGLFLVSSAACGFAWNMISLIGFRALLGLGAGAILPIATTIVGDLYPGAASGRVQGYVSSLWGIAAVSGPLLGAFLIQHFTWAAGVLGQFADRNLLHRHARERTGRECRAAPAPHRLRRLGPADDRHRRRDAGGHPMGASPGAAARRISAGRCRGTDAFRPQ
jgi:MFS family permease